MKKYLYFTLNQRKENLNNFIEENKALESQLKQIQKEKYSIKKNIKKIYEREKNPFMKPYENVQLKLLFQNEDIKQVKSSIGYLKNLFLEKCEEMRNLMFLSKEENILLLKDECDQLKELLKEKINFLRNQKYLEQQQKDQEDNKLQDFYEQNKTIQLKIKEVEESIKNYQIQIKQYEQKKKNRAKSCRFVKLNDKSLNQSQSKKQKSKSKSRKLTNEILESKNQVQLLKIVDEMQNKIQKQKKKIEKKQKIAEKTLIFQSLQKNLFLENKQIQNICDMVLRYKKGKNVYKGDIVFPQWLYASSISEINSLIENTCNFKKISKKLKTISEYNFRINKNELEVIKSNIQQLKKNIFDQEIKSWPFIKVYLQQNFDFDQNTYDFLNFYLFKVYHCLSISTINLNVLKSIDYDSIFELIESFESKQNRQIKEEKIHCGFLIIKKIFKNKSNLYINEGFRKIVEFFEEISAALKIQSVFRGKQARKEVNVIKKSVSRISVNQNEEQNKEKSLIDQNEDFENEDKQEQSENQSNDINDFKDNSKSQEEQNNNQIENEDKELDMILKKSPNEDEAAIKVQKVFRGNQVRKEVKKLKIQKVGKEQNQEYDNIEQDQENECDVKDQSVEDLIDDF